METQNSTNFRGVGGNASTSGVSPVAGVNPSVAPVASQTQNPIPQGRSFVAPQTTANNQTLSQPTRPVFSGVNASAQQNTPPNIGPAPAARPAAPIPLFARPQQQTVQSMTAPPPGTPPVTPIKTQPNPTQKQTYPTPTFSKEQTSKTNVQPPKPPRRKLRLSIPAKRIGIGALVLLLVVGGSFAFFVSQTQNQNNNSVGSDSDASNRFDTLQLPLSELSQTGQISLEGGKTLSINGQLKVNNTLVLTPTGQPTNGIAGQIYYDQTNNVLSYYNGSQFVEVATGTNLLQSLGGLTGAITVGSGLTASGSTLSNSGVLSLQGQTGAVTLTAGSGIAVDGTTISNTGILAIGGQTGSISVGNGLTMTGGEIKNSGVIGVSEGTNISIVNLGNGVYSISSSAGGGNVSTAGGTSGKIAKFTGVSTIADSLITESGSNITISGDLDVTGQLDLGTALKVINGGTGTNTLAANGVLVGNGTSAVSSVTAGGTGLCFMSTAGAPAFSACPSAAGVDMLNGLTGTLTIANASAAGSTITIDNASTSQKGIASFNSTNFTASSGAINTIQDINTTAAPTFGRLTVTSSQAASTMMLVNNTNAGASGNLIDLQTNSVTQMSISPAGAMTLVGNINGQTISSSANFTGTLGVSGLASLSGGATVTGTLTANTITPTSSMTVGATGQSLLLQGNALTKLEATDGANTTTLSFVTPTADVTYRLQTTSAGTYDICTTVGNCAGSGGGVTTLGGTTNKLAKFSSSQVIADSIITDNGSTVTIGGTLSVNTLAPTGALTVGATGQSFLLQGNASSTMTATDSGNTTTISFQTPTASVAYRFATALAGTYDICTTVGNCAGSGGGVTTLGGTAGRIAKFTGSQTIADSILSESGTTITVNGTLTANTITPTGALTVGATGQSFLLQGSATSTITSTDSGNTTTLSFVTPTADVIYRLQTATAGTYDICTSANNCGYANAALSNLSSVAINTSLLPGAAGAIDIGSSSLPLRDIYVSGSSSTPASNNFRITGTATGARTITLPDASGTVCIDTNNCNYVSLQASSPGTAQTGNINVGGTIIAGTSLQAPLLSTADATSGSTAALTMRTGDLTGGSSTATGDLTIRSGNASGTAQSSGDINIDSGTATGTTGTLSVGAANASALTVGNTSAALSLYGTAASTMTFQNGVNTTTLSFQTPTASVTYVLPTATAGSYDICTSVGNCAGSGGGVTTPGGTSGKIAKFTGSQTIADSLISESGSTISIDGDLNLTTGHEYQINGSQISSADLSNNSNLAKLNITQTFTGATNSFKNASDSTDAFNIQDASSQSLFTADTTGKQITLGDASALAGKLTFYNASNSNAVSLVSSVATASRTIYLPDENGTICLQSSTACGFAASSGSNSYIQNTTTVQTNANIAIQGVSDSEITALIRERPTQTADVFRVEDAYSNYQLRIDTYGALHVAQSSSFDRVVGIGSLGASSGEKLRIGVLDATDIGLNIYGNGSQTADLLRITAGGAQPILAVGGSGQVSLQNRTNSTTALTVSNASSQTLFRVDTSNNLTVLGNTGGQAGGLAITDGAYTNTLSSGTLTTNRAIALPNEDGTICLQSSTACGFAASSGSSNYIQNQIASQQSSSNFWISAIGRADTAFQAPLIDTATATALNVGTTNATAIYLNQDTTIAAAKQLSVTSGATSLTGAATGDALTVSNSTSTGRIAVFKDDGTEVVVIGNGGSTSITTTTDSTTAFTVQGTVGSPVLYADTYNNTVRLRTLFADGTSTYDAIWLQGNKNGVTAFIGGNDDVDGYGVNESSSNLRWNGSNVAWGDIGYYPMGGGDGSYGQFRFSITGSVINTTPDAKVGVGSLYAATEIGINNTSPSEALDVSGNINVGSANSYKIGGVIALEASGDYLRVNQSNQFSNGIYTGTSGLRVGGTTGILVGSAGGDGQIGLIPNGSDNTRRITLDGGTGAITAYTGSLTGATSGDALTVSNSTSTGNILVLKDNSTTVATVANGGAATFQNSANSTAAFRVLNSAGSSLFNIDSTNGGLASLLGMNSGETGSWSSASTAMITSRAYAGTAVANGYAYVVGGSLVGVPQTTVSYAKVNSDGSTGSWTSNTYSLPVATAYTAATAQNGYLYVLGGSNASGTEQTTVYFARLNSDGSTGSWYTTTALPAARSNGSVVSANGYVYYICGQDSTDTAQSSTYYAKINGDGTLGSWTSGSTVLLGRKSAQVVTANGYIYVAGGVDSLGTYQSSVYYATLNASTGAIGLFSTTTSMAAARTEGSAIVSNGYMYVLGGRDSSTYQTTVYYSKLSGTDGTAGTWSTASNALPAARGGSSAFNYNGYTYMVGGYNGSSTTTTVYSASTARVQIGASLDLVGLQTTNTTSAGDTTQGSAGGSLTAGNGTFVGNLQVQGMTNLSQGLNVNGVTTLEGSTYVAGTLSLSSTLAAYEGFENVTFPPSGGTGTWTTGGNTNWARSTTVYQEGVASAASGTITDSQSSWLDVDYTWSQSGSVSFAWKVSSESGYDYLYVCVDYDSTCSTNYSYRMSGDSGWQQLTIPVTAGTHSIRWLYAKDGATSTGSDKGWVDNVRFNGGEGKITGNGINFSPASGYNITIGDNDSTAALLVLDRYNGSSDPAGANGAMYYSTYYSKFRCFENSVWKNCINTPETSEFYASSNQSITDATDTRLTFDSSVVDDAPITVTGNNEFTFDRVGKWQISATTRYGAAAGGTGERYLAIAKSVSVGQPNPRYAQQSAPGTSSYPVSLNAATTMYVDSTDISDGLTISIYTFQNSGASLNTDSSWNGVRVNLTWLGY